MGQSKQTSGTRALIFSCRFVTHAQRVEQREPRADHRARFRSGRKPPDKLLITRPFAVKGSVLDREDLASRDAGAVEIVTASTVDSRNEAQRAPTRRQGFVDAFRECAQTSVVRIAKTPCLSAESFEGDGLKNRRLSRLILGNPGRRRRDRPQCARECAPRRRHTHDCA